MKKLVVLKATWCGPCKVYAPVVEDAKAEIEAKGFTVETLDVDENREFVDKHGVRGVPTTLMMDGDNVISMKSGTLTKDQLLSSLDRGTLKE